MHLKNSKIIIIKIGSSLLVDADRKIRKKWLTSFAKDIKKLKSKNKKIVIVSSGAIALGCKKMNYNKTNLRLDKSQAIASIGQIELMNLFSQTFLKFKLNISQILLTLEDTEERRRSINAKRTFENLFELDYIPIVNENDTIATSEIKYGDNDRLAARVAQIIGADTLIILSDVDGLYDKSKKKNIIRTVSKIDSNIYALVEDKKNSYGSGGIMTKLDAAKICMNSGSQMLIANGQKLNPLKKIFENNNYTRFVPKISTLAARKKWIVSSISSSAKIYIDDGATKAINNGKSLLPAGIIRVLGNFKKGENILIVDKNNNELARGLSSFSSIEIQKIKGLQSSQIENILGYSSKSEIIHKDDMVKL